MSKDIHILNLAAYEAPEANEDSRKDWVTWGEGNSQWDFLIKRHENSATNSAVINNISRLIVGKGLYAKDANRKANEFAQMMTLFSKETQKKVAKEYKMLGHAALQVIYKGKKVARVEHIPVNLLAPEKCNDKGEIEAYYYSDNWSDTRKFPPQRIKAFGFGGDIEILFIKDYAVGKKYFGDIDYRGCIGYAVLEEEISDYLINEVQNGFSGTKIVNFNNGIPDEEQQDTISNKVMSKLTGSRGQKVVVAFNNNAENKTTVEDIPLNDAPDHYTYLSTEARDKILAGHNVTSSMLVGITTESQGFNSNADEIIVAANYFHSTVIKPFQEVLLDAFDKILAVNGISLDLYFRRLNLLEEEEKKEQAQELSLSEQTFLDGFGEEESEEWVLIDKREVDYDLEDELDRQVESWIEEQKQETTLSRIWNFVSSGTARGNAKSSQDKEVQGFHFKVRYKYTGNPTPERDFCKLMMQKNKIYRKEDIIQMGSQAANAGFGFQGAANYDIFKFKGGPRCHHKWQRRTYVSATKSIDVKSPNAKTISTGKAQKFGYRVDNPKEVSMKPNDMAHKGYHPNNPNKPLDAR
jgi:hypothetical protein